MEDVLEIKPIWEQEIYVRTFETDFENRWKPSAFFQTIQETATTHAAHLGFDYEKMFALNRIWILSRVKIQFQSFPTMGEIILVKTWPKGIQQKVFFTRDFLFSAPDGKPYASATTAWILIDPHARRMLMPNALIGELPYHKESALDEELTKIVPGDNLPELLHTTAGYSAIDLMRHVNNARYIEWIMDCFPFEYLESHQLDWMQINYLNEVKPGDAVSIAAGQRSDDPEEWIIKATNQSASNWAFEAAVHWLRRASS
jgi:medium-chain acyl-[acyl-carrier-protein] hydrolase